MTCTHSCVRFVFRCCAHSSAYIVMGGLIKRVYTIVNILVCSFGTPFVTIGFSPEMNCRTRLWPAELRVWLRGYRNPRAQPKGGGTNGSQASWTFPFPSSSSSSPSDKSPFLFLSYGRSWKIIAVATGVLVRAFAGHTHCESLLDLTKSIPPVQRLGYLHSIVDNAFGSGVQWTCVPLLSFPHYTL